MRDRHTAHGSAPRSLRGSGLGLGLGPGLRLGLELGLGLGLGFWLDRRHEACGDSEARPRRTGRAGKGLVVRVRLVGAKAVDQLAPAPPRVGSSLQLGQAAAATGGGGGGGPDAVVVGRSAHARGRSAWTDGQWRAANDAGARSEHAGEEGHQHLPSGGGGGGGSLAVRPRCPRSKQVPSSRREGNGRLETR